MTDSLVSDMPVQGARALDDFTPAADLSEIADDAFLQEAEKFMGEVVSFLQSQKERCEQARNAEEIRFSERYDLNERRARLSLLQRTTPDGKLDETFGDGHITAGVQQGWTCGSINTASAVLYPQLFESGPRPYLLEGRGDRPENPTLVKIITAITDDLLKRGRFSKRGGAVADMIPRHGTSVLRYEMGLAAEFERTAGVNGEEFQENNLRLLPRFSVWDIKNVLFTHPQCPLMEDQEGVYYISNDVSVVDLEKDAVIITEEGRAVGKYRNLQQVYDAAGDGNVQSLNGKNASAYPQYTLVEFEGRLPIFHWLRKGVLSWRVLKFFGVDVGKGQPDLNDPKQARAWATRLSQIPVWNVAYLTDANGYLGDGAPQVLLRFSPAPGRVPRRSGYVFINVSSGKSIYGLSTNDLGRKLEDSADEYLNNDLRAVAFNADPTYFVDPQALYNDGVDKVGTMLRDGKQIVQIKPGAGKTVGDAVYPIQLPRVVDVLDIIGLLKSSFEDCTGITSAVKGMTNAKTLGQDKINLNQSQTLFSRIVLRAAQTIAELITDMISDVLFYTSIPGKAPDDMTFAEKYAPFVDYASRVSGVPPSEIEKMLPTMDGLENEIIVTHPAQPGADKTVLVQLMMQIYGITQGQGFADPKSFVKACVDLVYPRQDSLFVADEGGMEPTDEERMLAQGNYIPPRMDEDFQKHIITHQTRLAELAQPRLNGTPSETDRLLLEQLTTHLDDTMQLFGLVQQMQALTQAAQQQPAPQSTGSKEGPSKKPQEGLQTESEMASDMQGKANPQPPTPEPIPGGGMQ